MASPVEIWRRHPDLRYFIDKVMKDNIGMLAAVVSWTLLTSIIPICVGLIAISSLFLRDAGSQQTIVDHLSYALQDVLSHKDLQSLVRVTVQHRGLLGIIGIIGVVWGGSNVGGAISTVFQPIFQVRGRSIIREKLIDIGMIVVFTVLMLLIILATTAGALLDRLFYTYPLSGPTTFVIGTLVSLLAGYVLFTVIYVVFPNIRPRFKPGNVWKGAVLAAVLLQILSYAFPIYAHFSHFQRYGAVLFPIVVLTGWIYFFSIILILGAEIVAMGALREARQRGEEIGPPPDGTVPQRSDRYGGQAS